MVGLLVSYFLNCLLMTLIGYQFCACEIKPKFRA